jgi:uncharacterized protein DUF6545
VKEIVFPVCAVLSWIALFYRIWGIRRSISPTFGAMCVMYALLGITFTVSTPAVSAAMDRLTEIPNIGALCIHCSVVGYSITGQIMLLHWTHPPEQARRKARWRLVALGVMLTTMGTLFVLAGAKDRAEHFFLQYNGKPLVVAYGLLYVLALSTTQIITIRICVRYAKFVERRWLRRGLRAVAVASALALVYSATRAADIVAAQIGADASKWEILVPIFAGSGAILGIVGLTIPTWGPRLSAAADWVKQYRSYRRLYPLWAVLYRATPDIALDPPRSAFADSMTLRDLDFRLYRRVIEIRDGQRELRPWFDPVVAAAAARLGRQAALSGDELETTIEAATLKAALSRAGQDDDIPPESPSIDVDVHGGSDVSSEITWLTQVAHAFTNSPTVAAAIASVEHPATTSPITS